MAAAPTRPTTASSVEGMPAEMKPAELGRAEEAAAEAAERAELATDEAAAATDEAAREAELDPAADMDDIREPDDETVTAAEEVTELMPEEAAGAGLPSAAAWKAANDWLSVGLMANTMPAAQC